MNFSAGWLSDFTNWLVGIIKAVWDAFVEVIGDFFLFIFHQSSLMVTMILELLPVPDFITGNDLQSLLGQAGPSIAWFITVFKVDAALAVIGVGSVFYIIRRVATLGIW